MIFVSYQSIYALGFKGLGLFSMSPFIGSASFPEDFPEIALVWDEKSISPVNVHSFLRNEIFITLKTCSQKVFKSPKIVWATEKITWYKYPYSILPQKFSRFINLCKHFRPMDHGPEQVFRHMNDLQNKIITYVKILSIQANFFIQLLIMHGISVNL